MELTGNETPTAKKPLYSQVGISIATFFGGPLAAGVLVRRNYLNMDNELYGRHALSVGILSSLLLFGGLFALPEEIINKIPNSLLPGIYTAIIYVVVEKVQRKTLKEHQVNQGPFYSNWRAAGVGLVYMMVLVAGLFAYGYLFADDVNPEYDKRLAEFHKNEEAALELFSFAGTSDAEKIIAFIRETGIPSWEKCLQNLDDMDRIENLAADFKKQNDILREYCRLRIEAYRLMEQALIEETDRYANELDELHRKIKEQIDKL